MVMITPIKEHDSTKEAKLLHLQQYCICWNRETRNVIVSNKTAILQSYHVLQYLANCPYSRFETGWSRASPCGKMCASVTVGYNCLNLFPDDQRYQQRNELW